MKFQINIKSLLLLIILFFATKSFSFNLTEVVKGIFVHFGAQEETNKKILVTLQI